MYISYDEALKNLDFEYWDALDNMWDENGFGESVELKKFLSAWTRYISETTEQAAKHGWLG